MSRSQKQRASPGKHQRICRVETLRGVPAASRYTASAHTGAPVATSAPDVAPPDGSLAPDPVAYSGGFTGLSGLSLNRLTVGGAARGVWVYAPVDRGARPPLLLTFHDDDATGDTMLDASGARRVADLRGVVVVAPDARPLTAGDYDHDWTADTPLGRTPRMNFQRDSVARVEGYVDGLHERGPLRPLQQPLQRGGHLLGRALQPAGGGVPVVVPRGVGLRAVPGGGRPGQLLLHLGPLPLHDGRLHGPRARRRHGPG